MRHTLPLAATLVALLAANFALVAMAPGLALQRPQTIVATLPLIAALTLPTAALLALLPRVAKLPHTHLTFVVLLLCGLAMRLPWLAVPAPLEDDFYRYLWDGALLANGWNPYAIAPRQLLDGAVPDNAITGLAIAGRAVIERITFPDLTTIYPGAAQLTFAAAHLLAPFSLNALRVLFIASDAASLLLLVHLLRHTGRSPLLAAAYWLNPLVVFLTTATAHVDAVMVPFILAAVALSRRGVTTAAGLCLAVAAGVKIWPLLLAPLIAAKNRRPWTALVTPGLAFAALSTLLLAPLAVSVFSGQSGLGAYANAWSNNNAPYAWASYALYVIFGDAIGPQRLLRLSLAAAALLATLVLARKAANAPPNEDRRLAELSIMAALVFYLSPAQFPWYALGFLALAAARADRALLLASATLPVYYFFFPLWEDDENDVFQYGVALLHSLPVWTALLWRWRQRDRPSTTPRSPEKLDQPRWTTTSASASSSPP